MSQADNKQRVTEELVALLCAETMVVLQRFKNEHPQESMYAFTYVSAAEGQYILCAIATDRTLETVAKEYAGSGYQAKSGETLALLRRWLKWQNPDDGWYYYEFDKPDGVNAMLTKAITSKVIELYDGTTSEVCVAALRRLDANLAFGPPGLLRDRVAIGYTYGEDPEDFIGFAEVINPPEVMSRLHQEVAEGDAAREQIISPYE